MARFMGAARVDKNQSKIIKAFEAIGCKVVNLSKVGDGVPDLLVWLRKPALWVMVEVKNPEAAPCDRRLTPDQVACHEELEAYRAAHCIIETVDDVLHLAHTGDWQSLKGTASKPKAKA